MTCPRRTTVANRLRAVALVAVVAVVVASCGIPTDAAPHAIPKSDVPFHLLSPPSPSTTTISATPSARPRAVSRDSVSRRRMSSR